MNPPRSASFVLRHRVRFADCDPAGIAYYPRIIGWFHAVMEAWFDDGLGTPYAEVIAGGIGLPTVHTEADFRRPCALGDDVDIALSVGRIGRTSVQLRFRITGRDVPDDLRVQGHSVVVVTDLAAMAPCPLPDALRTAMQRFVGEGA